MSSDSVLIEMWSTNIPSESSVRCIGLSGLYWEMAKHYLWKSFYSGAFQGWGKEAAYPAIQWADCYSIALFSDPYLCSRCWVRGSWVSLCQAPEYLRLQWGRVDPPHLWLVAPLQTLHYTFFNCFSSPPRTFHWNDHDSWRVLRKELIMNESTIQSHGNIHFKWVNHMVCELYPNKAIKNYPHIKSVQKVNPTFLMKEAK